jgi:hypothetical protein
MAQISHFAKYSAAVALCGTVACTTSFSRSAQQANRDLGVKAAESGPSLKLTIHVSTVQIGERIPIELSFTADEIHRFQINKAQYDRSGRMNYEEFRVDPAVGTRDPLRTYFSTGAFLGGGLTSFDFLSSSPVIIKLDLNEWVSFEKPGTYHLTVVSHRVSDAHSFANSRGPGLELKSNTIELKVIPADAVWQHELYKKSVQIIETSAPPDPMRSDAAAQPREQAVRDLRFLGTEEAVRELARLIRGDNSNEDIECMFGIIGSHYRAAGMEELKKEFTAPDYPVSNAFLTAMTKLSLDPSESIETLRDQDTQTYKLFLDQLRAVLPQKRGKALSTSLNSLLVYADETIPSEHRDQIIGELTSVFDQLSAQDQATWLSFRWDAVKDPQWLPILRRLAQNAQDFDNSREITAYQSLQAMGAALTDWYELDPKGAREAVLSEITRPKPRFDMKILGVLPDKTLPDAEHTIAANFLATDSYEVEANLASLLYRYAGPEVLPEVINKIQTKVGTWACQAQDNSLAYVLKVDPESAEALIQQAIQARGPGKNGCRHELLQTIGNLETKSDRVLEEIAIASLDDPDPETALSSVNYLAEHGTADAEQRLWTQYEAWSQQWQDRSSELQFVTAGANPHVWDANLGRALVLALGQGLGWFADEDKLRSIAKLAVGDEMHQQIDAMIQAASMRPLVLRYTAVHAREYSGSFQIAQYELRSVDAVKMKLAQFPRGTQIAIPTDPGMKSEDAQILQQMAEYAAQIGLVVAPLREK